MRSLALAIFLLAALAGPLLAQAVTSPSANNKSAHVPSMIGNGNGISTLPGGIDGEKNPELIPDSQAYRLFFIAICEPPDATPDRRARQGGLASRQHLSPSDLDGLFSVLSAFYTQALPLGLVAGSPVKQPPGTDPAAFESLVDALVSATHDALRARLSPEGLAQIEAHVQREKSRMTIFPEPSMAAK